MERIRKRQVEEMLRSIESLKQLAKKGDRQAIEVFNKMQMVVNCE